MSAVSVPKGPIKLAGVLYEPPSEHKTNRSPGLVVVHPGGGVKEQTAGLYARRLAGAGFTTLCYDASFQGESGGSLHFLEDPRERVSDVWAAADFLESRPGVDPERLAVVGICAGGGYAVAAATAYHRLRVAAAVSLVNIGDSVRRGWDGDEDPARHVGALGTVAAQMRAENAAGPDPSLATVPYVPPEPHDKTARDLREAADYYLTSRAQHPLAANKMLLRSLPRLLTFDAFAFSDLYLKQPLLLIAGDKAGSLWHTERLDKVVGGAASKVVGGAASKVIVPGATHIDFYDNDPVVGPAVEKMAEFIKANLK